MNIPNYPGLSRRLYESGVSVEYIYHEADPPVLRVSDEAAAQAIIDAYTLADASRFVCAEITAHARTLRDKATDGVAPGEMASWPIKRAEALAYQADNAAPTPMLAAEAAARQMPVANIVARVAANATALGGLEAKIAGISGRHCDAINACTTFDAIAVYDWSTDWPEL